MRISTLMMISAVAALSAASGVMAAPATTQSSPDGPHIAWPEGWVDKKPSKATTTQLGNNPTLDAEVLLSEAPASDYADDLSTADYAGRHIEKIKVAGVFKTAKFTPPVQRQVGGHDATVVDADVIINSIKFHYQVTFVKEGGYFCTLFLWSVPSKWQRTAAQADVLVAALH